MNATTILIARYLSQKAIKALLHDAGIKLNRFSNRDLRLAANEYLQEHRDDLLAQADAMIAASPDLRKLAQQQERWQERWRARRAKMTSDAQGEQP